MWVENSRDKGRAPKDYRVPVMDQMLTFPVSVNPYSNSRSEGLSLHFTDDRKTDTQSVGYLSKTIQLKSRGF